MTAFPQNFKHYQIRGPLGEGGFAEVYQAWDSKLCREVALKRLKATSPLLKPADLMQEARLAASLEHAAFVRIYSVEEDEHSQSIVMELVRGKTLKQLLETGPLDQRSAVGIARQIAHAMQLAHSLGLIHGDLKPSNIMQDASGTVRILDFGLASQTDAAATTTMTQADPQGTIAYMAGELMQGAANSIRTDIYALGVTLYVMLSGERPFPSLNGLMLAAALVQSHSSQWSYGPGMHPALADLIRAMTARDPLARPASMQDIIDRLDLIEPPDPSGRFDRSGSLGAAAGAALQQSLPQSLPPPLSPTTRRLRPAKTAAIAALSLAVLLGGGALWRSGALSLPQSLAALSPAREMAAGVDALRLYDRPGKLDEADTHFNRILAREPGNAAAVAGLSILYSRRHQSDGQDEIWLQRATAAAQQALILDNQLALAHAANGIALERAGKSELALAALDSALKLDPNNLFALLGRVKAHTNLRQYEPARTYAAQGLLKYPQERSFADLIGRSYFEQGRYVEAERAFRISLSLQPDAVFAYANLNAALLRQGRSDDALQVLQQGLALRPNAWLYGNLGNALFLRGDYPGAVAAFENAVSPHKGNPGSYLGWANLADALLWIPGRKAEASKAYAKARQLLAPRLEGAPRDPLLVSRMGLYMARSGERSGVAAHMEKALALAPASLDMHFRAGLAFELIGERVRAIAEIRKAAELGYPVKLIDAEPDLLALRRDPRYPQQ